MNPGRQKSAAGLKVLNAGQCDAYWRQGWLVLRNLFSAKEVTSWREECDRVWKTLESRSLDPRIQWRYHQDGGQVADRIDPLLDISPLFARLSEEVRLTDAVADLIGARPDLMKGKVIMKRPGTMGYAVHRDYPYYRFLGIPADEFVIASLALDACSAESGAVEAFPDRMNKVLPAPDENPYDVDGVQVDMGPGVLIDLEPGDVALFHSLLPHRSAPNRTRQARRTLYFTYVKAGYEDVYQRYYAGRPDPQDTQLRHTPIPG